MSLFFGFTLAFLALFIILLVLVQRGRGGGLTGALGGMGGSSAFGAKAGDVFTRITIVTTAIWIVLCVAASYWAGHRSDRFGSASTPPVTTIEDKIPPETSFVNPPTKDNLGDLISEPAAESADGEATANGEANTTNGEAATTDEGDKTAEEK